MYGWIQETIEALVLEQFGAETWAKIKEEAELSNVPDGGFARHEYYDDSITYRIVAAASKVLGLEPDAVLTVYGEFFISWMMNMGYGSMLRNQGATMLQFLQSMDEFHSGLQTGLPKLVPPKIRCWAEGEDLVLEYTSQREGLAAMMIGLVKGVGKHIFRSSYTCDITEQSSCEEAGQKLQRTTYLIKVEHGRSLTHVETFPKSTANSGSRLFEMIASAGGTRTSTSENKFFDHNVAMAGAWRCVMEKRISSVSSTQDAINFGTNFDVHQLISLLEVSSPDAGRALVALFRKPLSREGFPLPEYGYMHGEGGTRGIRIKMLASPEMTRDVVTGADALVHVAKTAGMRQVPIDVSVCMVPCLGAGGWLFHGLANTPNDEILQSVQAYALLQFAWMQVLPRICFDRVLDLCLLSLTTAWCIEPSYRYIGWQLIIPMACKSIFEQSLQAVRYRLRSWSDWSPLSRFSQVCSLGLQVLLLFSVSQPQEKGKESPGSSNAPLAAFTAFHWWFALWNLRGFATFGPKILPILFTLASMGPFTLVMLMLLAGFFAALSALDSQGLHGDTLWMIFRLGLIADSESIPETLLATEGWGFWLFGFLLVVTIIMVNILIGILSESYDFHQDSADIAFARERARLILSTYMCLYPQSELPSNPFLRLVRQTFFIEEADDWMAGHRKCFLWMCTPLNKTGSQSRLHIIKDSVSKLADDSNHNLAEIVRRLKDLEQMHHAFVSPHAACPLSQVGHAVL